MKKLFSLAAVMLLSVGAMWAQDNYTRLQVSYIIDKMTNSEFLEKEIMPKGVTLGAVQGFLVSNEYPLYVEPGVNLTWAHSAVDLASGAAEDKFTYMNFAIPINAVYKYEINDKVAVSGQAGLNFKLNLLSKEHFTAVGSSKESFNWLSKKDMGSRDNRASIFQLGGQFGVGFHIQDLYLGYQFQFDFVKFQSVEDKTAGNIIFNERFKGDDHRWLTNYITIGYTIF